MRRFTVLAMMLCLLWSIANGQRVSLDSCRSMAVRNNKTLRIAEQGILEAGYLKRAAQAAYLPGIDFAGSYFHNQHKTELLSADAMLPTKRFNPLTMQYEWNVLTDPVSGQAIRDPQTGSAIPNEVAVIPKDAMSFDTRNVFAGAFTLTQPVFMGGQIRAMNQITKYAEQLARTARNSAVQDVVFAVDEAYWMVVSLAEKKRLAEAFVNLVDTFRHDVDAMLKQGVATRSDLLTVDVKLNEARILLTKASNGLTLSRMALAQLCGCPVDSRMELADEGMEPDEGVPVEVGYADANMADVYASRQDLMSVRHAISMFESKEKLALGDMLPKLAIVGAYSFSNPNLNHGFEKKFGGGFNIGATLVVPLWHWGGNYNKYKAAKVQTNMQRLLLEDLEEKVNLQVQQARFSYDEAYKTYDMTRLNRKKADENLRQARLAYREGVGTTAEVIAAQTAWVQAHSEQIDANIGIRLCGVYLSKVLGRMSLPAGALISDN